jgi:1-acyl-sn-glycerol-3-phosphate acyltransferase
LIRVGKAFALGAAIGACGTIAAFLGAFFKKHRARWVQKSFQLFLSILRVRTWVSGDVRHLHQGGVLVANHISYLDIPIIGALVPVAFLTSTEVQKSFPEGWMAKVGGSLFVDRMHRSTVASGIRDMQELVASGGNAAFFPEGTSSKGEGVLPFKSSLFETAVLAGVPIIPVAIRYTKGSETVSYHGDHRFLAHFWRVLRLKSIDVRISVLEPLKGEDRKMLAKLSHDRIEQSYLAG